MSFGTLGVCGADAAIPANMLRSPGSFLFAKKNFTFQTICVILIKMYILFMQQNKLP